MKRNICSVAIIDLFFCRKLTFRDVYVTKGIIAPADRKGGKAEEDGNTGETAPSVEKEPTGLRL